MKKRALILGILGQDGSYLAELLDSKGYEVHGIVKENTLRQRIDNMEKLIPNVIIYKTNILNKTKLKFHIEMIYPDEIYNFAGVSDVFTPWNNLDNTLELNARVPQHLLEIILEVNRSIKLFQASSCLIFGKSVNGKQNESTPRCPTYPYGISKLYADNMISEARKTFDLFVCSGILFPHESERRGECFFTKKVTSAVANLQAGKFGKNKLQLGDLSQLRDWGYAPDYVMAAWLMLQAKEPQDYVVGSGNLTRAEDFVKMAFECIYLNYSEYIEYDLNLLRSNDINTLCADNSKIKKELGWIPKTTVKEMIKIMIDSEIKSMLYD